jgi:HPt (histidine-containing phosphotransfer) domain-containing protein
MDGKNMQLLQQPGQGNQVPVPGDRRAALDLLARLPGFDVSRGLASLSGNEEKYLAILWRFLASRDKTMDALAASLAAGDRPAVRAMAHTLYGSASTLGARRLAELARGLETALGDSAPALADSTSLNESAAAIADEFQGLDDALPSMRSPTSKATVTGDLQLLTVVREQLHALLSQNDFDAIDYFRDHSALIMASLGAEGAEVERLIEGFEFQAALQALKPDA